jgi:alpha-glucuronidase
MGILLLTALGPGRAVAQTFPTYKDLYDFGGNFINSQGELQPDGRCPGSGFIFDQEGNMYGITKAGGYFDYFGTVWEITAAGVYKDLHDFGGTTVNANGQSGPDGSGASGVTVDNQVRIPTKTNTHSERKRTAIPMESEHRFRFIPNGDSDENRTRRSLG